MAKDRPALTVFFSEAFKVWVRVALLSFGGPAGQIAVMHRILVDEKRWVSEPRFLHALNYCMLLPGPEAQQLATYIGWLLHGTPGGLVAGVLFVLPGFWSILALSICYVTHRELALVQGIFFGLKPAVVAVVVEALLRIARRSLRNGPLVGLAAAAFVGIFFLEVPFPLIVLCAGLVGFLGVRFAPHVFLPDPELDRCADGQGTVISDATAAAAWPTLGRAVQVGSLWLMLWWAPVVVCWLGFGSNSIYTQEGIFFGKVAAVSFGGAYAVLAYVAQEAVHRYCWLSPGEMLDGLGMAETTPGPLIQVVQFVAFLAAYRKPEPLDPMLGAILGSSITTWATFAPSFLWIFLGSPYIEALRGHRALNGALSGITAAVVGVVLNLSIWFAMHTFFSEIGEYRTYGVRWLLPQWDSVQLPAVFLAVIAMFLLFRFKEGMIVTLLVSAGLGAVWRLVVAR
jgi:chromate transporter